MVPFSLLGVRGLFCSVSRVTIFFAAHVVLKYWLLEILRYIVGSCSFDCGPYSIPLVLQLVGLYCICEVAIRYLFLNIIW